MQRPRIPKSGLLLAFLLLHIARALDVNFYECIDENGQKIFRHKLCDGVSDCPNEDDEQRDTCDRECRTDRHYQCGDTGRCLRLYWLCNGVDDCANGEDEHRQVCDRACPGEHSYLCADTGNCIARTELCDGTNNCGNRQAGPSGLDEQRDVCDKACTNAHYYQCPDQAGRCIGRWQLCDGRPHCANGEDEQADVCDREKTPKTNNPVTGTSTTASTLRTRRPQQLGRVTTTTTTITPPPQPQSYDATCGEPAIEARAQARIHGGRPAVVGSWPWHAALLIEGVYQCGAVLITQRVAVTAAHCVNKLVWEDAPLPFLSFAILMGPALSTTVRSTTKTGVTRPRVPPTQEYQESFSVTPGLFTVVLGSSYRNAGPDRADHYAVERFVVHPEFRQPKLFSNDLALLFLAERVQLRDVVNTVCVGHRPPPPGSYGVVTGWGMTGATDSGSELLRQVELPLVTGAQCNGPDVYNGAVDTQSQFCAGRPGKDSCKGDSGGPLVTVGQTRGWTLSGIVSWGWYCGVTKYPGVYTSVSHAFPWIQAQVLAMNYTHIGDKLLCDCD